MVRSTWRLRHLLLITLCVAAGYHLWTYLLLKYYVNPRTVPVLQLPDGQVALQGQDTGITGVAMETHLLCVDAHVYVSKETLSFPICIHDPERDVYVSGSLSRGVLYEMGYVQELMSVLSRLPGDAGLLDIGAHVGVYSLTAAHLRHPVLAVDAMSENVLRLRTAVQLANIQDQIRVLHAAVTDHRSEVYAMHNPNNIGGTSIVEKDQCFHPTCDVTKPIRGVLLDDLVDIIPFSRGVMKIDIEGLEKEAMTQAGELLDKVDLVVILMEWRHYKLLVGAPSTWTSVENLIFTLTSRGYVPTAVTSNLALDLSIWYQWPTEVLWRKSYN